MLERLLSWSIAVLMSAAGVSGQTVTLVRSGHIDSYSLESQRIPKWNGAALTAIENNIVHSFDQDGQELRVAVVSIPGATRVLLNDAAAQSDGALVVCGSASGRDGRQGGFLSFIPADRTSARIVQTAPYRASMIAVSPDGTVWTRGKVDTDKMRSKDSTIIRHFDPSGRLLEGFIPQDSLSYEELTGIGDGVGGLSAAPGRVGWYQSKAKRYFEIVNGVVHDYPGLPLGDKELVDGLAILESGDVFVSKATLGKPGFEIYTLDRSAGNWQHVAFPAQGEVADVTRLAGQYRDQLVFQSKDWRTLRVVTVTR
jgi:hypothetical protein